MLPFCELCNRSVRERLGFGFGVWVKDKGAMAFAEGLARGFLLLLALHGILLGGRSGVLCFGLTLLRGGVEGG